MTNKLSFNTQLRYAAFGITGFLVPALAISNYTGLYGAVVVGLGVGVAFTSGLLLGSGPEDEDVTGS